MHLMKQRRRRRASRDQCAPTNAAESAFFLADEGLDWLASVADQLEPKAKVGLVLLVDEVRHWRALAAEAEETE